MRSRLVVLFSLVFVCAAVASGQERAILPAVSQQPPAETPARAEVLVLGVYHMANPGRDVFDTQADDVLAPRRQAEMARHTALVHSDPAAAAGRQPVLGRAG